ncbi:conserved membrane hypothetical protein [uncultured Paludibacter sp.]|uniref:DUF4126 domain-containing protein n=1 Tax=uncultured Paludibacter sp. TaxID=497635 RepID=A0A653AIX8_9BACT|nr:conserved membrane hypothetical protein [uncultured Paludibacter sp.]
MNEEIIKIITAVALGIGLSASTGFRVFIPMLVASLAAKFGIFHPTGSFEWLGSIPAIIVFGSATVVEIAAYYIPFVDNILDSITTPLSIGAGTLLMTSVLPVDNELLKWITGFIVGGGAAATIQGGSVLTRLTSSKFTAGTGNHVVATGENVAAFSASSLAFFIPIIIAILFIILFVVSFRKLFKWIKKKKEKKQSKSQL